LFGEWDFFPPETLFPFFLRPFSTAWTLIPPPRSPIRAHRGTCLPLLVQIPDECTLFIFPLNIFVRFFPPCRIALCLPLVALVGIPTTWFDCQPPGAHVHGFPCTILLSYYGIFVCAAPPALDYVFFEFLGFCFWSVGMLAVFL